MFNVISLRRLNGSRPFEEYVEALYVSGNKKEAARIYETVERLAELGSARLAEIRWASKLNDIWELRRGPHRVFYFWDASAKVYVLLHGFRKKTPKTPVLEIQRAESLRSEYFR